MTHGPMKAIDLLQVYNVNRLKPALDQKAGEKVWRAFLHVPGSFTHQNVIPSHIQPNHIHVAEGIQLLLWPQLNFTSFVRIHILLVIIKNDPKGSLPLKKKRLNLD